MNDYRKYLKSESSSLYLDDNIKSINSNYYGYESFVDVYPRLLEDRVLFLTTEIDSHSSNLIKSQLLYLDSISNEDISIYIDSPGGSVYSGFGIIDIMDFVKSDVSTVNVGLAASMGAIILAYGENGKRKSLKRSRTMIHQPLGGAYGQASDIEIDAQEIIKVKKELYGILEDKTTQSYDKIHNDADRDYWMTSKDALDYGLIDIIL